MNDKAQRPGIQTKLQVKETWPEKMKLSEARRFLGVSHTKITSLVKTGVIPHERYPLDHRVKLIKKSDLERLKQVWDRR